MNMNSWMKNRYKLFNQKIDRVKDHPKYQWLRQYADDAIRWNNCFGYYQIKAADFIKRIEKATDEYILAWLDGKNNLEWTGIRKE